MVKLVTLVVVLGSTLLTRAQTLPTVIQAKTPEVAAFNKRVETPVALYTGVPNISIPLCEAITKGASVPITLDYHAGGVQVEQEATWVGLGWSLNYGGQISRKQRGAPDEDYFFGSNTSQVSYYLGLPDFNSDNILQARVGAINNAKHGLDDYMPDEFYYAMPGYSGRFMYGQRQHSFVLFPKEDIRIARFSNSNHVLTGWKLCDPNGTRVEYGQDGRVSQTTSTTGKTVSTSWNIKRLTDPYQQSITYQYATYSYGSLKAASESALLALHLATGSGSGPGQVDGQIQYGTHPYFTYNDALPTTITFPGGTITFATIAREDIAAPGQALSTITVTNSTGQVVKTINFQYSYFYGDAFAAFTNTLLPASYSYKRLRLDAITVVNAAAPTQSQTYRFDYYITPQLPSKYSYARDHWGYYNGINNQHLIPNLIPEKFTGGNRQVVPSQAIAFSLKSIQYPEGGKTTFVYGSNTAQAPAYPRMTAYHDDTHFIEHEQHIQVSGYNRTSFYAAGSSPISKKFDKPTHKYTYRLPFTIGEGSYPHIGFSWVCNTNFGLKSSDNQLPNCTFNTVEFRLERIGPNGKRTAVNVFNTGDQHCAQSSVPRSGQDAKALYADVHDRPTYSNTSTGQTILSTSSLNGDGVLYGGSYEMVLQINNAGVDSLSEQNTYNNNHNTFFSVQWRQLDAQDNTLYAGGLRVDTIKYYNTNGILLRQRAYSYDTPASLRYTGSAPTSGRFASFPSYVQNTIWVGADQLDGITYGRQYSSNSVVPLETTASSICGYEYVTESDVDVTNAANKLTSISHFSFSPPYYSAFYPLNGLTAIEPNEWMRGKLLDKQYLKADIPVQREEYNYYTYSPHLTNSNQEDYVQELNTDLLSFSLYGLNRGNHVFDFCDNINNNKCTTYYGLVDGNMPGMVPSTYTGQGQGNQTQYLNVDPYYTQVPYFERHTAFDKPLAKTTTHYDATGRSFVEQETYLYEKTPLLHQLTTTQKRLTSGDTLRTRIQYPLGDASPAGQALVAQHRLTVPVQQQTFKNRQLLATTQTAYQLRADSLVLPQLVRTSQGLNPFVTSVRFLAYDDAGNLVRAQQKAQSANAYIWAYNSQYPIAEITNAGNEAVAYTSFETPELGNWLGGSLNRTTGSRTGTQGYDVSAGPIQSPTLRAGTTYLVNYWTTSAQPLASIGGTAVALRTVKGWTYYQHTVTGVTSVALTGSGVIDDLSLLPVGAQLTTLTYQPLVGISSKTGPDGRTVFYEYDSLQRLQRVTDEQGRILSVNAYHYAGK